jgi:hypothetical protein
MAYRTLTHATILLLFIGGAVVLPTALVGCGDSGDSSVGECASTPRPEDGLYVCGDALVRREVTPACTNERPGEPGSCAVDTDCDPGFVCYCGPLGIPGSRYDFEEGFSITTASGRCSRASCSISADCGEGSSCFAIASNRGCDPSVEFLCSSDSDACVGSADCEGECLVREGETYCGSAEGGGDC